VCTRAEIVQLQPAACRPNSLDIRLELKQDARLSIATSVQHRSFFLGNQTLPGSLFSEYEFSP
jgi:hypothetical protein